MRQVAWGAALAAGLLGGCSSGAGEVEVTGKVTLNDQPVGAGNEALIRFTPADGKGQPADGFVDKGAYSVRVPPGAYKVAVTWNRPTGKKVARAGMKGPGSEVDEVVAEIPARYNTSTELKADVSAGSARHDFALKK
jgi:hypothetical protein